MSFYGNSYFYTAETFARVILNNLGLGNATTAPENGFDKDNTYFLDASKRAAGLTIAAGNQWIALEPDVENNRFALWHNAPTLEGDQVAVIADMQKNDPTIPGGENAKKLGFEDYIKIPVFYYDAAGHVSTSGQMIYFQLPESPIKELDEIKDRMNDIDGKDKEPEGGSLKTKLEKAISDYEDAKIKIQTAVDAASTAKTQADNAKTAADNAQTSANTAKESASAANESATKAKDSAASANEAANEALRELLSLEKRVYALEHPEIN